MLQINLETDQHLCAFMQIYLDESSIVVREVVADG